MSRLIDHSICFVASGLSVFNATSKKQSVQYNLEVMISDDVENY